MNTIHKLNQYLLERYPIAWNTKILSVIGISLVVHLLFFIIGFSSYDPLESGNVNFGIGLILFNIIISIIILLFWIMSLSKNNAFKDYYPTSANKLFIHFIHSFVIVFFATTFFISHQFGVSSFVGINFSKEKLEKEIEQVNKGAIFLSFDKRNYNDESDYASRPYQISYYNYNIDFVNPLDSYDNPNFKNEIKILLDSPDNKQKITKILTDFLIVAKKYKAETNLDVQKWLNVIYSDKETPFGLNNLIDRGSESYGSAANPDKLYFDGYGFKNSLSKQKNLFEKSNVISTSLHFFVWFSLIFATAVFIIRTTSLRLFLLSVVAVFLVYMASGLFLFLIDLNFGLPIVICVLIITSPYLILKEKSDTISGILINIGFPAFSALISSSYIYVENHRAFRMDFPMVSLAFFLATFCFVYSRCFLVKKWNGLPAG